MRSCPSRRTLVLLGDQHDSDANCHEIFGHHSLFFSARVSLSLSCPPPPPSRSTSPSHFLSLCFPLILSLSCAHSLFLSARISLSPSCSLPPPLLPLSLSLSLSCLTPSTSAPPSPTAVSLSLCASSSSSVLLRFQKVFNALDDNKSGSVSLIEFLNYFKPTNAGVVAHVSRLLQMVKGAIYNYQGSLRYLFYQV